MSAYSSSNSSFDETQALVIDIGSEMTTAGFAGDDAPRCVMPTVVGHKRCKLTGLTRNAYEHVIGDCVRSRRNELLMCHPVKHGIVVDWDDMETLISHIYDTELRVKPEDQPALFTEPIQNPNGNREKTIQIMFEKFHVPEFYMECQSKLSLYSSGRGSGVVLDSGGGVTTVFVVYEGYCPKSSLRRVDIGGMDVTCYMARLLQEKGYSFTSTGELDIIRQLKETHCYVSQDFDEELLSWKETDNKNYELPDGSVINIGNEQIRCPEAMFDPSLLGVQSGGVHQLVYDTLNAVSSDCCGDLYCNIIISGGNTMFPGFDERLQKELKCLLPPVKRVKVVAAPERNYFVWIGGSILASLSCMSQIWITRADYDEFGPAIIHKKYF